MDLTQLDETCAAVLRAHEQRYTPARRLLVRTLAAAGRPLTIPALRAAAPELAQSSCYRNLDVLAQVGVVRPLPTIDAFVHFELASPAVHAYVRCPTCSSITTISGPAVDDLIAAATGLLPAAVAARIELAATCTDCVAAAATLAGAAA